MKELFMASYYWLDLLVGFGSPLLLYLLVRYKIVPGRDWRLFWLGALIGLTWEAPFFLLSRLSAYPVVEWIREPPVHYLIYLVGHTLWDGALFLTGVWLVRIICKAPVMTEFRWLELATLLFWGQLTAILVEYSAVSNEAWSFIDSYWFNPTMIQLEAGAITWMMQVIWLPACILFYFIALKVKVFGSDPAN